MEPHVRKKNIEQEGVARAAGVAPGLAYHYFDSKEKMFAETIEDYARMVRLQTESADWML